MEGPVRSVNKSELQIIGNWESTTGSILFSISYCIF